MFINEQANESIFKFESCDVIFLENDFSQRGDISWDLDLIEIDESDTSTAPFQPIPKVEDDHDEFHPSIGERNI